MARTQKVGLDYFPHDVDMLTDQKMRIIKAKHGLIGYAVFIRLLEEIYRDKGYYLKHNDEFAYIFCDDNNIDFNVYINMINDYINYDLFDKKTFNVHNVLTSKRIQLNYLEAVKRRQVINLEKRLVIKCAEIDVYINEENVNINLIDDDIGTQRKEKKRKEEKSKEDIVGKPDAVPYKEIIEYFNAKFENTSVPKVKTLSQKRKNAIKSRGGRDAMKELIDKAAASDFLIGKVKPNNFFTLDWLINPNNAAKVLDGNYDNNEHTGKPQDIKEWQRHQKGGHGHYI